MLQEGHKVGQGLGLARLMVQQFCHGWASDNENVSAHEELKRCCAIYAHKNAVTLVISDGAGP
jgi:hypothetical protein